MGSGRLPCRRSPRLRGDARVGQTYVLKQLDVIRALEIGLQDRADHRHTGCRRVTEEVIGGSGESAR